MGDFCWITPTAYLPHCAGPIKCRKTRDALVGYPGRRRSVRAFALLPVEKRAFNALHIKRRPSNNLILSILDRRHSRLQMRMNWRNFERWVYLCLAGFIIAHSSPTHLPAVRVPSARTYERTPLSHSKCVVNVTRLIWDPERRTALPFRNDSRPREPECREWDIPRSAQRNRSALSVS